VSVGLDSSVVLRLLTGLPEAQAEAAYDALQRCLQAGELVHVSDLVLAEVYFALQHHYGVDKAAALDLLARFISESGVTAGGAAAEVLRTPGLATAKPGFVDRLIHADCLRQAGGMLTFERSAGRLPGARVLTARPGGT